jgi:hypothetical protein
VIGRQQLVGQGRERKGQEEVEKVVVQRVFLNKGHLAEDQNREEARLQHQGGEPASPDFAGRLQGVLIVLAEILAPGKFSGQGRLFETGQLIHMVDEGTA